MAEQFEIAGGPSKFDLMVSLFDTPREEDRVCSLPPNQRPVIFLIKGRLDVTVYILSIQREDGSGESWNFCGWSPSPGWTNGRIRGYYSTKKRTGMIGVEKQ